MSICDGEGGNGHWMTVDQQQVTSPLLQTGSYSDSDLEEREKHHPPADC